MINLKPPDEHTERENEEHADGDKSKGTVP